MQSLRVFLLAAVMPTMFGWIASNAFSADDSLPPKDAEKAARAATDAWLKLVDEAKYDESWQDAAELFRKVASKEMWATAVKGAREPLGKLESRQFKSAEYKTMLPGAPDGQYFILQYDTKFENKKEAVETVTPMLDKDGKWHVTGYFVR